VNVAVHVEIIGQTEAILRLLSGRLGEQHTPDELVVCGDAAGIELLRLVFPGY